MLDGTISNKTAKEVFAALWQRPGQRALDAIIETRGLKQISDPAAIENIVDEVLAANARSVEEFRAGKEKAFNALVGQAMKATRVKPTRNKSTRFCGGSWQGAGADAAPRLCARAYARREDA